MAEVRVKQDTLDKALTGIKGGSSSKGIQVAFRNFLVKVAPGQVEFFTTDGSLLERAVILAGADTRVSGEDQFLVNAEEFSKLVASFEKDKEIILTSDEIAVTFKCKKHETKYKRREKEEDEIVQFPEVHEYELTNPLTYGFALESVLKKVAFAKEKLEMNVRTWDMSGVYLKLSGLEESKIKILARATDQNKAASLSGTIRTSRVCLQNGEQVEVYLKDKVVSEAVRIKVGSIDINRDGKVVVLKAENGVSLFWKCGDFKFPDLSGVLDKASQDVFSLKIDRKEFLEVATRSGLLSDDERANYRNVLFKFNPTFLEGREVAISGEGLNIGKKFSDMIPILRVEGEVPTMEVALDPDHLIDFLKAQTGSEIIAKVRRDGDFFAMTTDENDILRDQEYLYVVAFMEQT